jgi:hypothetical protein
MENQKIVLANLPLFGPVMGEYVKKNENGNEYEIKNPVVLIQDMMSPGKVNLGKFGDVFAGFSQLITTAPYTVIPEDSGLYKSYMSVITGITIASKVPEPNKGPIIIS